MSPLGGYITTWLVRVAIIWLALKLVTLGSTVQMIAAACILASMTEPPERGRQ